MLEQFISQVQYLIGEYGYKFLCSTDQRYSNSNFQRLLELRILLNYLTSSTIESQDLEQLVDFFEVRYNLNEVPYINYPNRITNILTGIGTSSPSVTFSGVNEAPFNSLLHARINGQWQSFVIPNTYTQAESDGRFYPLNSNPAGYLTSASLSTYVQTSTLNNYYTQTEVDNTFYPLTNPSGYITASSLHDAVTLGTTNGLSLTGQQLSLALATTSVSGAMSASDKTKLDNLTIHDQVTLNVTNGLSLSGQVLSLALATTSTAGALSASDKIKLDSLTNYTHPDGFTNQPVSALTGNTVISRIFVNTNGHVTGVDTRELNLATVGVTAAALTKVDDTNVTLTLGGTPETSLLQATSLTLGWTGTLAVSRGGTGVATITSGEVLIGNGTSSITTLSRNGIDTRATFPASTHNLTSHSDVTLGTPSTGQVLGYNGTAWTNVTLDLNSFDYEEADPIFVAFRDASRSANTFYSSPNGTSGIASFRAITVNDIPDVYVRFDINQTLTEAQKSRVRNTIGVASNSTNFEPAFLKGDVVSNTGTPLTITNGTGRIVGISDLIIEHDVSEWTAKTTLATDQIISNLTVDEFGHISDWSVRTLTLEDLGFVAFDPTLIESTLEDYEDRITALEAIIATFPGDKNYIHEQSTPATVWTYNHGLNKKPSITIIDSAGSQILAKITYIDLNNVEIDFDGSETAGEAINN